MSNKLDLQGLYVLTLETEAGELPLQLSFGGGPSGKSAYEVWLEQGNSGTEEDFFNSLSVSWATVGW